MKDLLYLKDEQIKEFIQLLYYAYRETFSDPKEVLSKKFFGRQEKKLDVLFGAALPSEPPILESFKKNGRPNISWT